MARSGSTQKKENNFKEFEFTGKEFKYSGRIYPSMKTEGERVDSTPFSLCLNGVLTIKNCKLIQSDKSTWIQFPQYKTKAGDYQSYIYVDKEFSQAEIDNLAQQLEALI